jgi:hypothetical protein
VRHVLYTQSVYFAVSERSRPSISCQATMPRRYSVASACSNLYPGFLISKLHANRYADGDVGHRESIVQTEMGTPGLARLARLPAVRWTVVAIESAWRL